MDRFDVVRFEDLSGPQGREWIRIGGGSFGVVFRGEYIGTKVAIKEVLPNKTYDVEKYFERECVLMKEARHPNIVQYIGLSRSPGPDGRIYIVSEFVGGNLRSYIADPGRPFDWRLRASFATDIARAVAYLHARNCMHRDLKGENLLITDNLRIKVCDFGFARIAARNDDEMRRISFCGTDGYMSPEILMGIDFSLPSDVFSLGIIFCEIISRRLVDSYTFKRSAPTFGLDENEVRQLAQDGCPADFVQLALDMCRVEPLERPTMRDVVIRLCAIEQELVNRETAKGTVRNIGSVRGKNMAAAVNGKHAQQKPSLSRKIPSFDGAVHVRHAENGHPRPSQLRSISDVNSDSSDDSEADEALSELERFELDDASLKAAQTFKINGHGNPWWSQDGSNVPTASPEQRQGHGGRTSTIKMQRPEAPKKVEASQNQDTYSTDVVRASRTARRGSLADSVSRMTGVGAAPALEDGSKGKTARKTRPALTEQTNKDTAQRGERSEGQGTNPRPGHSEEPSIAGATIGSSVSVYKECAVLFHRFSLVKNGIRRMPSDSTDTESRRCTTQDGSRVPYQLVLANALTKCSVCNRRLGFKDYMDCDDCSMKCHTGCADAAEPDCQELSIPAAATREGGDPQMPGSYDAPPCPMTPSKGKPATKTCDEAVARSPVGSPKMGVLNKKRHSKTPPPKVEAKQTSPNRSK